MADFKIRPSKKFEALIVLAGSVHAAAQKWDVPYMTLHLFVDGKGSLPGNTIAKLIEKTGLDYEELFEHEREKAKG